MTVSIWIKAMVLWLLKRENRAIGLRYTKMGLDVFEQVCKKTKSQKDDLAVAYIAKQFDKAINLNNQMSNPVIQSAAQHITKIQKGSLKDVALDFDGNSVKAHLR